MSSVPAERPDALRVLNAPLDLWTANLGGCRRQHLFYAAAILVICGMAIFIGAPPAMKYADDCSQFLDAGWRLLNGQKPHLDFYSPLGMFCYFPTVVGLMFSHTARALGYSNAFIAIVIGAWAYGIARRRMNSFPSIVAALFLTLLATAPYPLGQPPWVSSYAMIYNRQAYSLLGILLIEAYGAPGRQVGRKRFELTGSLSSGIVCGILFFLKPTYFLMSVAILTTAFVCRRQGRTRVSWLAGGFGLVSLEVLCFLRFDIGALVSDLAMVAGARSTGLGSPKFVLSAIASFFPSLSLMVCAILAPKTADPLSPPERYLYRHRQIIFAAVVSLVGFLLLLTNCQYGGLPLNALFAMVLANGIRFERSRTPANPRRGRFAAGVLVLTVIVALPAIEVDAVGFGYALRGAHHWRSSGTNLPDAETLAGFVIPPDSTAPGPGYLSYINDGVELLRRASGSSETVANLDFSNPFTYALARPPFRGGAIGMEYHNTFSDEHTPSPEWLLGGADLVMVPKYPTLPLEPLMRIYGEFLHQRFRLCAESSRWFLYRQVR
jgi:hypothetical protein